jgi:hypothetical protein
VKYLLASLACLLAAASLSAQAELWPKAVEAYARGKSLKPGKASVLFKELDGAGKEKSATSMEMRISFGAEGAPEYELVSVTKNGEDVTKDFAKQGKNGQPKAGQSAQGKAGQESEPRQGGGPFGGMGMVPDANFPLDPLAQGSITLVPGAAFQTKGGRRYALIPFESRQGKTVFKGSLRVEADSGFPVELNLDIPIPSPAAGTFTYSYFFSKAKGGAPLPSVQEYEGKASFLLLSFRFDGRIELSEYK